MRARKVAIELLLCKWSAIRLEDEIPWRTNVRAEGRGFHKSEPKPARDLTVLPHGNVACSLLVLDWHRRHDFRLLHVATCLLRSSYPFGWPRSACQKNL